ncbi:MucR family transcriptional regulator [Ahrensia sp. 13_GOM-1096m]|uniref:MucR family transcriptional regulator n=1 Tax=Ahrensia sp. 13_GOM-1096m TaxID=1380380 RepID=UPI00047DCF92|nr:MucR family transcriptional regulator [Ahrensia sp. 13_GOM-1096m]
MDSNEKNTEFNEYLAELTAQVVSAYVGNNNITADELPSLISNVHGALNSTVGNVQAGEVEKPKPAVNPKKSVLDDCITCLEDGMQFKSLKRHLMSHHGLTPQDYREKWDLPSDYPMVAPSYAERRSKLAQEMGLGRKSK